MSNNTYDDLIIHEIIKKRNTERDHSNYNQIHLELPVYDRFREEEVKKKEKEEPRRVIIIDI